MEIGLRPPTVKSSCAGPGPCVAEFVESLALIDRVAQCARPDISCCHMHHRARIAAVSLSPVCASVAYADAVAASCGAGTCSTIVTLSAHPRQCKRCETATVPCWLSKLRLTALVLGLTAPRHPKHCVRPYVRCPGPARGRGAKAALRICRAACFGIAGPDTKRVVCL